MRLATEELIGYIAVIILFAVFAQWISELDLR